MKASTSHFITKKMPYETQFYVAEGSFDRLKKRTLGLIAKHGGSIDRSTLLQNLPITYAGLKRILETLFARDQIESEMKSNGKLMYYIKKNALAA